MVSNGFWLIISERLWPFANAITADRDKACVGIGRCGAGHTADDDKPSTYSGGMQQRLQLPESGAHPESYLYGTNPTAE